jgi:hypothetical protein
VIAARPKAQLADRPAALPKPIHHDHQGTLESAPAWDRGPAPVADD